MKVLFINPLRSQRSEVPTKNAMISLFEILWHTRKGLEETRGVHTCHDGMTSTNRNYRFLGAEVNSLFIYYLKWYWDVIPAADLEQIEIMYYRGLPSAKDEKLKNNWGMPITGTDAEVAIRKASAALSKTTNPGKKAYYLSKIKNLRRRLTVPQQNIHDFNALGL